MGELLLLLLTNHFEELHLSCVGCCIGLWWLLMCTRIDYRSMYSAGRLLCMPAQPEDTQTVTCSLPTCQLPSRAARACSAYTSLSIRTEKSCGAFELL
jgi:hypothetical protein